MQEQEYNLRWCLLLCLPWSIPCLLLKKRSSEDPNNYSAMRVWYTCPVSLRQPWTLVASSSLLSLSLSLFSRFWGSLSFEVDRKLETIANSFIPVVRRSHAVHTLRSEMSSFTVTWVALCLRIRIILQRYSPWVCSVFICHLCLTRVQICILFFGWIVIAPGVHWIC